MLDLTSIQKERAAALAKQALATEPLLAKKIAAASQLPEAEAEALLCETLRFMQLLAARPGREPRLVPSQLVDLAWHELILFTRSYAQLCQEEFGKFVHHYPGGKEEENREGFKRSHYYYQKAFGQAAPQKYWGHVLAEISDASDCGL